MALVIRSARAKTSTAPLRSTALAGRPYEIPETSVMRSLQCLQQIPQNDCNA